MATIFRRSEDGRELLRSTVRSLGETSVAGLAAALSWRTRRVERLLVEELSTPGSPVMYDANRRVVCWAPPASRNWGFPAPPPRTAPAASPYDSVVPSPSGLEAAEKADELCPSCHVPLVTTVAGHIAVCPACGRLGASSSEPRTAAPTPQPIPPPPPAAETDPNRFGDRKSQELLAAYMTSRPILCPRCQTPLRHQGLSSYRCPSCGETVRFSSPSRPVHRAVGGATVSSSVSPPEREASRAGISRSASSATTDALALGGGRTDASSIAVLAASYAHLPGSGAQPWTDESRRTRVPSRSGSSTGPGPFTVRPPPRPPPSPPEGTPGRPGAARFRPACRVTGHPRP